MYKLGTLVSVYHAEDPALFTRAMQSIITQQISAPAEVRIYLGVDGAVPDALRTAIEKIEPHIYKLFWFKNNRGLAHVMNDLISAREDEDFFFRMDTDDISLPQRFDHQLHYMLNRPEVDISGTDMVELDTTSHTSRVVRYANSHEQARQLIAYRVPVAHPTVCFRARVFDRVSGYPIVHFNEDIAMWFACMKAGLHFDNLHEPLYEFRLDERFWQRRGFLKAWSEFLVYVTGLWDLDGITWKYVYPLARFIMRVAPLRLQKMGYSSRFRRSGQSRCGNGMDSECTRRK
jgi:glycosyltransferase involved in cell wall biosynthesis